MFLFASWLLGFPLALLVIIFVVAVLIVIFEIWMIVDAISNTLISTERKVLWLIGMLLVHPFVAIAYYFTDRKGPAL